MQSSLRYSALLALLGVAACAGHHHWQRDGSSHEASHADLTRCEATAGGSAIGVEECMMEKGYSAGHHVSPAPPQRPALGAIPRLPF